LRWHPVVVGQQDLALQNPSVTNSINHCILCAQNTI
jgi:hypothetical protein